MSVLLLAKYDAKRTVSPDLMRTYRLNKDDHRTNVLFFSGLQPKTLKKLLFLYPIMTWLIIMTRYIADVMLVFLKIYQCSIYGLMDAFFALLQLKLRLYESFQMPLLRLHAWNGKTAMQVNNGNQCVETDKRPQGQEKNVWWPSLSIMWRRIKASTSPEHAAIWTLLNVTLEHSWSVQWKKKKTTTTTSH